MCILLCGPKPGQCQDGALFLRKYIKTKKTLINVIFLPSRKQYSITWSIGHLQKVHLIWLEILLTGK